MKKLSLCLLLLLAACLRPAWGDAVVVFNEVMYHPASNEPTNEWVELRNQMAVDVDITGWSVDGAIQFSFRSNTIVRGGGFVLIAIRPDVLGTALGTTNLFGPFTGRLGNNGDSLILRDNSGRVRDRLDYLTEDPWPVGPDGSGASLAKLDRDGPSGVPENWAASEQPGGTPGADNFPMLGVVFPEARRSELTATWRYDASGADLGESWRAAGYNDSGWPTGAGALYHGVINAGVVRSIPTLFNTGVGNDGAVLAPGARDPHYVLVQAPQGGQTNAVVMINNGAWLANDAASSWIGVTNSGAVNVSHGAYFFQTRFTLDGFDPATARMSINVSADDRCTNAYLNGVALGVSFVGFSGYSPTFTVTNGFLPGTNTLEFRTVNDSTAPNPGGFRALVSGTAVAGITNTAVPAGPVTHYFRSRFNFTGNPASSRLRVNALVDDGAILYLNGVEVLRLNLPDGPVTAATPALSSVGRPIQTGLIEIPAGSLVEGENVLAAEVHQAADGAGDMAFALEVFTTPLPPQPPTIAINEVSSGTNAAFWLELVNHGPNPVDLAGYQLISDGDVDGTHTLPAGLIAPGGFLAVTNDTLGFQPTPGDKLYLVAATGGRVLDAVVVKRALRGRSPDGTGRFLYPSAPTPGAANVFALRSDVVINELMYHQKVLPGTNGLPPTESPEQWLELHNRGSNAVDLTGWDLIAGVSYRFLPGTRLDPGGFLVLARDPVAMRAAYPSIDILGGFAGRLSGRGEPILLVDAVGNPADELRYYDYGRWPEYADGGGSSLELRDPWADNSKAEAWAASDESTRGEWITVTYRATAAIPGNNGQPAGFAETIFGLLGAGECLIDDISVLESPTNAPIQLIANGNFENGLAGWRVLGTHGRSRVIADPGNPGNKVLHVIATGAQEHMHNHIETTHLGQRVATSGRLYEISFRARWLAGNNLLNSRLYFNRCARTTALPYPAQTGTPGRTNSRREPNIGPTFASFAHSPVIPAPGAPVTVTVTAQDPQGVTNGWLHWSISGGSWSTAPMTARGQGRYEGSIPGQPAGTVVQFHVSAADGLGATADYPAAGRNSGALFKVADGQADLSLGHNIRILLTPANTDLLHAFTNVMSNDDVPGTVVVDEKRAYYNVGVRLKGSERGRYSDIRTSFHLKFPAEDPFRGVHPFMLVDRSGAGDTTQNKQEEILIRHMVVRAGGLAGLQADIARVLAPRAVHNGPSILIPRFEDEFVATAFNNGGDGRMWELELIYYPTSTNAFGYKNPNPDGVITDLNDISDMGLDKEFYRYNFIAKNGRDVDDYTPFIAMARTWSLNGAQLQQQAPLTIDVDNWMRSWAMFTLCSVGDAYTFGNNHNLLMYLRPDDKKIIPFLWDMDFSFNRGETASLVGDRNLSKIINLTPNLRCFYAHLLDIIGTTFNGAYMSNWVGHYQRFCPGQNFTTNPNRAAFIHARANFARNTINAAGNTNVFRINSTNLPPSTNNFVTLTGIAPFTAKTITINGREYPITWTSATAWSIRVPLEPGTNLFTAQGWDLHGQPLTNMVRSTSVVYDGQTPDPAGQVVFSEIMYNPPARNAGFIELFNNSSTHGFDLSDWRLNGLDYQFPPGTILTTRQTLVLAADTTFYAAAYHTNAASAYDRFPGNLQNNGEVLSLLRPGASPGEEILVDRVRYENVPAWPSSTDGFGPSLQLIDPAQDNSRVANWSDGAGWRQFSFTSPAGLNGTNVTFWLATAGELVADKFSLVEGSVPEAGVNLISNGDFESGVLGPWSATGNHATSAVIDTTAYDGTHSLRITATGTGGPASLLQQAVPLMNSASTYTFSFWYLPSTSGSGFHFRLTSTFRNTAAADYRPIVATPGRPNSTAAVLPPFSPLWLNEVQPENVTGRADNQGEREPWVELYNPSAAPVALDGYYLSDNYTNLARWAFPAGATVQPGEFKIVVLDAEPAESTAAEWHAGFRPAAGSGSVVLSWTPSGSIQVLDYFNYTGIGTDRSYGSFPDGQPFYRQAFYRVTAAAANTNTAAPIVAYINEWMALNTRTIQNANNAGRFNDWFELYNPGETPVHLGGHFLTDNLADRFQFAIPDGFVIPAQGYLLVWADNRPSVNDTNRPEIHVNFALDQNGESIGLFAADGTTIDLVSFGPHLADISEGRLPNGTGPAFHLVTATPSAANTGGGNRRPAIAAVTNRTLLTGETLAFTATVTDPDLPAQSFIFALAPSSPTNASVTADGRFSWTPTPAQAPSTNIITLLVTDNGVPALTGTEMFTVIVLPGVRVNGIERGPNGSLTLTLGTTPGRTYQIEYKDDLNAPDWTPLGPSFIATQSGTRVTDNLNGLPQRFYRLAEGP